MWFAVSASSLMTMAVHWDLADIRLAWFCLAMLVTQCAWGRRNIQGQIDQEYLQDPSEEGTCPAGFMK